MTMKGEEEEKKGNIREGEKKGKEQGSVPI